MEGFSFGFRGSRILDKLVVESLVIGVAQGVGKLRCGK